MILCHPLEHPKTMQQPGGAHKLFYDMVFYFTITANEIGLINPCCSRGYLGFCDRVILYHPLEKPNTLEQPDRVHKHFYDMVFYFTITANEFGLINPDCSRGYE